MPASSPTVDSFELARLRQRIEGEVAIARLPRLLDFLASSDGVLHYRIEGLIDEEVRAGATLSLRGMLILTCQRCNDPLEFELNRDLQFRFVATEEELNAMPLEDDDADLIVGSRTINVDDWIEDEAILSLPLVPRHDRCSISSAAIGDAQSAPSNPFAVLSDLKNAALKPN